MSEFNNFVRERRLGYREAVGEHYRRVLAVADRQRRCLNPAYPKERVPREIADLSLSTLWPLGLAGDLAGLRVLDVGCGAGADCFAAATMVGPGGFVLGVDPNGDLVARADALRCRHGAANVGFCVAGAERLPVASASVDLVTLNYAFHLVEEKPACLREIRRVLRPDGRLIVGDSFGPKGMDFCADPEAWLYGAGGAVSPEEFGEMALRAGFRECAFRPVQGEDAPPDEVIGYVVAHA